MRQFVHKYFAGLSTSALLTLAAVSAATPALADSPAIRNGTEPPAQHLGHVFMTFCEPQLHLMMERDFEKFKDLFSFTDRDGDTDHTIGSVDDNIRVTFDKNWEGAVCEMTVAPELADDGYAIYEDLIAHLEELDNIGEASAIDSGLIWEWVEQGSVDTSYSVEFLETSEGHILRTTAKLL